MKKIDLDKLLLLYLKMSDFQYWSDIEDQYNSNYTRISWQQYFKEICITTSKRSSCNKLHVGCILVKNNRIISSGYNGFLPKFPHNSIIKNGHEVATVHAEQNTIIDCAKRGICCTDASAYITHFPCLTCTKLLIASGIRNIYYINDYNNDPDVYHFVYDPINSNNRLPHITTTITKI
tara:strand:+ start:148 stop:681 length:534 start_codon:yes stop_codon:yes gene_type:complete